MLFLRLPQSHVLQAELGEGGVALGEVMSIDFGAGHSSSERADGHTEETRRSKGRMA